MSETAILIQTAQEKYNQGFNCAESVAASFASTYPQKISSQLVPLASAFGGGLGTGCLCGALAASTMILSNFIGRNQPSDADKTEIYALSKECHDLFTNKFSSACCKVVKNTAYGSAGPTGNCIQVTSLTAGLLNDFLQAKNLLK